MSPEMITEIYRGALGVMLALGGPILGVILVIGVSVSVIQAATQVNEMTLSFIPKILAVFAVLIVAGPWMLGLIQDFTRDLFLSIPGLIG